MQNVHIVGIDVSKKTIDVCAIFDRKNRWKSFENNESGFRNLKSWIATLGLVDPHICMESTGCYSESVAEFLYTSGCKISVINPLMIKAFRTSKAVRQKTDKSDAKIIAMFCLDNNPKPWTPKPRKNKELHEINVRIDALKSEQNRLICFLEGQYLNEIVKKSIQDEWDFVKNTIQALENEAKRIVEEEKKLKDQFDLLTGIKGVGSKTALMILADMPDVHKFGNAKQYAAFVGVTPSHFESGTSVNKESHISKLGSKKLRKVLYMTVLVVKNHNDHFKKFVEKLEEKGKKPKEIIVAIMRKLMHIFFGMLKNNQHFNENSAFAH